MRRLLFLGAVFCTTVCWMLLQKPAFLLFYHTQAAHSTLDEWLQVVWHGLTLDGTVAGYIAALPVLIVLVSFWMPLCDRVWQGVLKGYFVGIALVTAAIFTVDLGLYGYWGFRLDGSVLIYLSDPGEAMASVGWGEAMRQILIFLLYAGGMIWSYWLVVRLFRTDALSVPRRLVGSLATLLVGGLVFLAIRGGVTVATANVSKVYFSSEMFLNHAATNPLFSFLSSIGGNKDYASAYPFFTPSRREEIFAELRGNRPGADEGTPRLLKSDRPDVVLILLESFGRTLMDESVDGQVVMPNMQRFRREGIWFENFFANSFRTDRGEVAVLCGFPAQTTMSIMKLPRKSATLPSLARSLGDEGYRSLFMYGGDLNFTNQASFLYATGWERLVWQKDMGLDAPTSKWGYADDVVVDLFGDEVEAMSREESPFLASLLTLSSHEPFDVPYEKFDDKLLNSIAFSDEQVGRLVERLRRSPAWDNLLVVLVADHAYPYPYDTPYNSPQRHRIPMIWLGGAVVMPQTVETYASQIDLCATLLAQLNISHEEFDYSKNIFGSTPPHKFGYYCFSDGFGVVNAQGETIYDCATGTVTASENATSSEQTRDKNDSTTRLEWGQAMLQTTYEDIGHR